MLSCRLLLLPFVHLAVWTTTTTVNSQPESEPLQQRSSPVAAGSDVGSNFHCKKQASDGSFHCSFKVLPKPLTEDELHSPPKQHIPNAYQMELQYCDSDTGDCFTGQIQVTNRFQEDAPRRIDSNAGSVVVHVGDRVYHSPFSQYGTILERHLHIHRSYYDNPLDEADWLIELGTSHRLDWEDRQGYDTNGSSSNEPNRRYTTSSSVGTRTTGYADADVETQYVEPAVNAYKQAIRILSQVVSDPHMPPEDVMEASLELAYAYFQVTDAYSAKESPEKESSMSLEYLRKSEKLYRRILTDLQNNQSPYLLVDSMSIRNAMLTRALILVRLGIRLLDEAPVQGIAAPSGMDNFARGGMTVPRDASDTLLTNQGYDEQLNPQLEKELMQQYQNTVNQAALAEGYFREATTLYQHVLKNDPVHGLNKATAHRILHDYAIALQNIATAANMQGEYETSLTAAELSLDQYRGALKIWTENHGDPQEKFGVDPDVTDIFAAMADQLFQVSDYHLKLGRYERSKESYRESLQFYETHGIQPPSNAIIPQDNAVIEAYERALQEYQVMKSDRSVDLKDNEGEESQLFIEQEVGYEGDLHMYLGSLYMSQGDLFQAISHLTQAVHLYNRGGEHDKGILADVKFTLAEVYFKNGDFEDSIQLHAEALDLYQKIHIDGLNPLDPGVPKVKPTVVFQLDPFTDDISSDPLTKVSVPQTQATSHSSTSISGSKSKAVAGDDPISALVEYWYAAIANDTEEETGTGNINNIAQSDEL